MFQPCAIAVDLVAIPNAMANSSETIWFAWLSGKLLAAASIAATIASLVPDSSPLCSNKDAASIALASESAPPSTTKFGPLRSNNKAARPVATLGIMH